MLNNSAPCGAGVAARETGVSRRSPHAQVVPVAQGSSRARKLECGGVSVVDVVLPGGLQLPAHEHERATVAIVLSGSVQTALSDQRRNQTFPNTVISLPAGEVHANLVNGADSRIVILQPSAAAIEGELRSCARLLEEVRHCRDYRAAALAWTVAHELAAPDDVTPLLLDGLAREILACSARLNAAQHDALRPRWLLQSLELIHARFAASLRLEELAEEVGVHPVYFSRAFHAHMGCTMGAYLRGLRVDRAADLLASSNLSIADIALEAGFSDQSHLSNVFRRLRGMTPSGYRAQSRRGPKRK